MPQQRRRGMLQCHTWARLPSSLQHAGAQAEKVHLAPVQAASGNRRTRFSRVPSYESQDTSNLSGLLDNAAILESPLKRIGNGQVSNFRRVSEHFIGEQLCFDFVHRQHSLLEVREDVVSVRLV